MGMYKDSNNLSEWDVGIVNLEKWKLMRIACIQQYNLKKKIQFDNIFTFDIDSSDLDDDYKNSLHEDVNVLNKNLSPLDKYAIIESYKLYELFWIRSKGEVTEEQKNILQKIFNSCYEKLFQKGNIKFYTELPPGINRLKIVKKTREEKYGLFGKKIRLVEYEEENPFFQPIVQIIEKEPFLCIWRSCFLSQKAYGAQGDVNVTIFSKNGTFYHFEYCVDGEIIERPYIGEVDLRSEEQMLNLAYLIGEIFNQKPIKELFPDEFCA